MTIGGNTVTRLRDVLPQSPLFQYFDSAVVYEGETAFVQLVSAVGAKQSLADVPNTIYKDRDWCACVGDEFLPKTCTVCRRRISMGCRWRNILFRPRFYRTGDCHWGRCEFCDHGEGYTAGYRSKKIQDILGEITYLRDKYGARHFHFTDESYPPALFRKLTRGLIDSDMGIAWTTHMRFEKSLLKIRSGRMRRSPAASISTSATSRATSGCSG
ncbi:MAG: hypothetical protein MRJ92_14620 [Nitrospira sp.]|nr:hypothetical protein [Nitrospira sp.]